MQPTCNAVAIHSRIFQAVSCFVFFFSHFLWKTYLDFSFRSRHLFFVIGNKMEA